MSMGGFAARKCLQVRPGRMVTIIMSSVLMCPGGQERGEGDRYRAAGRVPGHRVPAASEDHRAARGGHQGGQERGGGMGPCELRR